MCIAEWDEKLAREWTSRTPETVAADPEWSQRAEQEFLKKYKAYIAVRPPQEQLDPRILELASNPSVPTHARPHLYYGLIFHLSDREAFIKRNGLEILPESDYESPDAADWYEAAARPTVECILSSRCMLDLDMITPLAWEEDLYVFALDDTERMCQNQKEVQDWWDGRVSRTLKILRRELGLGDQQPKWYWGSECGTRYQCPIPDYNPPQVRYRISKSDSSESESDDEEEDDDPGLDLYPNMKSDLKLNRY